MQNLLGKGKVIWEGQAVSWEVLLLSSIVQVEKGRQKKDRMGKEYVDRNKWRSLSVGKRLPQPRQPQPLRL